MLMRFDPFRELDRLTDQVWRSARVPSVPLDAYRQGDEVVVHVDLPGVSASDIDVTVEKDVLTITAERTWAREEGVDVLVTERGHGKVTRRLFLGEGLDHDKVAASYEDGVLTVRIPVAEQAKPRKVEIAAAGGAPAIETKAAA